MSHYCGAWNERSFFTEFPVRVIARPTIYNEFVVKALPHGNVPANTCYVCPVAAAIDLLQLGRTGEHGFHAVTATSIPNRYYFNRSTSALAASLRLAWPVYQNKIILSSQGTLAHFTHHIEKLVCEGVCPEKFEIDKLGLRRLDHLYDSAGLFAWRETVAEARTWGAERLASVAHRALQSINLIRCAPSSADGCTLYDPEAHQWHFISLDRYLASIGLRRSQITFDGKPASA